MYDKYDDGDREDVEVREDYMRKIGGSEIRDEICNRSERV